MGQFDIQHSDKRYTITEESFIINENPPFADVTITAIYDNDGCIWHLNPLMNLKGSSTTKFVVDGFYRHLFHPLFLDKLETGIRNHLSALSKLP